MERDENILKDMAMKYNSIAHKINGISRYELMKLLQDNKIRYPQLTMVVLIAEGKIIGNTYTRSYTAINEPVHSMVFNKVFVKADEYYNNRTIEKMRIENRLKNKSADAIVDKEVKVEEKVDYKILKELIQKNVSDDVIFTIFPNLK